MPKAIAYPFEPKSITYLRAGQFWAVPLSDGRFGCGRVLYVPGPSEPGPSLYLNTRIRSTTSGRAIAVTQATLPPQSCPASSAACLVAGGAHRRLPGVSQGRRQDFSRCGIPGNTLVGSPGLRSALA